MTTGNESIIVRLGLQVVVISSHHDLDLKKLKLGGHGLKSERLPSIQSRQALENFHHPKIHNMQLSFISILLAFISTVFASPLRILDNNIQAISVCSLLPCTTQLVPLTNFS